MENSIVLVSIGGLISLVSALCGIALQHLFDLRKQKLEMRQYPTQVLYGKQTEFYDKVILIFPEINGFITAINVWLGEYGSDAKQNVKDSVKNTECIWKFNQLVEVYFMYLPEKVLKTGNQLFAECFFLSNSPTITRTETCWDLFVVFQNTIRKCVGVDKISSDLLKAFDAHKQEEITETKTE